MADVKSFVVPWLEDAKIYSLADLDQVWANPKLARLMINECPLTPPKSVVNAITDAATKGNRYPGTSPDLKKKVAGIYDLNPDQVYLAHGSSECIDAMMRVFAQPGDEVIICKPTFSLYDVRARVCGAKPVTVPLNEDMEYDTEAILNAITDKTKVIIMCSPNNPTGNYIPDEDLMKLVKTGIPMFLDEAYLEFDPDRQSKVGLIKDYPNVVINRTLSKGYGLAGVRFGYLLGNPDVVSYFYKVQIPWNASLMSLAAAEAALDDQESLSARVKHNNENMDRFCTELGNIPGIRPFPAVGNFLLVDATDTGKSGKEVADYAMERGLMIKNMGSFHGRDGFFRLTFGTDSENERLMKTLMEFYKG